MDYEGDDMAPNNFRVTEVLPEWLQQPSLARLEEIYRSLG